MPSFNSSGVAINYVAQGEGPAIALVHGFAGTLVGNWRVSGWIDELVGQGRRVLALDCRGHGHSDKPHQPEAYAGDAMADDVIALLDHVGEPVADLMGYSMGGGIAAQLLVRRPERWRSVVLAGIGDLVLTPRVQRNAWTESLARALEADDPRAEPDASIRGFRLFADAVGADRLALAALQRSGRPMGVSREALASVDKPVLVALGDKDALVRSADRLVATIPSAEFVSVPGDHLSAVGNPIYKAAVREFLARHSPARVDD
jgi:pimeloyl-ACP methyl ester carboxylesterase